MNDIRRELEQELKHTVDRLKGLGGAIAFEDDPGAREDEGQGEAAGDAGRISEDREMTFAVRGLLVERANRLAEALDGALGLSAAPRPASPRDPSTPSACARPAPCSDTPPGRGCRCSGPAP